MKDSTFIFNNNLSAGANYLNLGNTSYIKLKMFAVLMGGILVNTIIFFSTFYTVFVISDIQSEIVKSVSIALMIANAILILSAAIPYKIKFLGVSIPNDSLLVINTIFRIEKNIEDYKISGKIIDFLERYENFEYNECVKILEKLIDDYPDLVIPKLNLSLVYLELEKYSESEVLLKNLLTNESGKKYEVLIKNNLAWTLLLKNDQHSIEEAEKISAEAYLKNKNFYNLLGTRGCILIELGRLEQGQSLLIKAERHKHNPQTDITGLAYLVYAYYRQKKYKKADAFLKKIHLRYEKARISDKKIFERLNRKMGLPEKNLQHKMPVLLN